jgi:protein-tyrosine kinase
MEHITRAIARAKEAPGASLSPPGRAEPSLQASQSRQGGPHNWGKEVRLSAAHLESKRIIAHDISDRRSKSFDMLRTQILQTMGAKSWNILGITSPTEGCGKSVIAANLALSIARQPGRSVLLVDLDLQKPEVAKSFGLNCTAGIGTVLEGKTHLEDSVIQACINNEKITVLPCASARANSSAWVASQSMADLIQDIKRDFRAWTVILDLPPVLMSDDVISILPQIDCVLFVATIGISTIGQIKECTRHLETTPMVRAVLNKSPEAITSYYSRYSNYTAKAAKK